MAKHILNFCLKFKFRILTVVRIQYTFSVRLPPRKNSKRIQLKGIFIGAKVVRGPDWEWGQQDGGEGNILKYIYEDCLKNKVNIHFSHKIFIYSSIILFPSK